MGLPFLVGENSHLYLYVWWNQRLVHIDPLLGIIQMKIGDFDEIRYKQVIAKLFYLYLYTLAISPSLGGSRQHKRTTKTMGTPLRSSSNDEGPSRVWMALLEQHSPSSPVFHNLRHFTDAISPTAPTTGLPL